VKASINGNQGVSMTAARPQGQPENVLGGALLAALVIPVGVVILALLSVIGAFASIVGFLVALAAVWLYRRGSGGYISRSGAWVVSGVMALTLLLGIWAGLVVAFAGGLGQLGNIGLPDFWPQFNANLPDDISANVLFIVLIIAFGAYGSFRVLGRAFRTERQATSPANFTGQPTTLPPAPQTYHDDIDAPPTGSADDKTAPPSTGS
jgi:hypothetical protein